MEVKKLINEQKNPFYDNGEIVMFLVKHGNEVCGRVAAIRYLRYNNFQDNNTGLFVFFECIDDQSVANLLLNVASDWLRDRGHTDVLGPSNPSLMDEIG